MHSVENLLSFLSNEDLEQFAIETKVDKYAKKLHGGLLFKLLVFCFVTEKDNSLRGMQSALESTIFRALAGITEDASIAHSSISERLNTIKPEYFEKIFRLCVQTYNPSSEDLLKEIVRFDSTIVSLSTKLIDLGYNLKGGSAEKLRLLKFTVGYSDSPECICFYTDSTYNSENVALTETIVGNQKSKNQINVFDRGITSRDNYDKLTSKNISFISRLNIGAKQELAKCNKLPKSAITETLKIISDKWVYLYNQRGKKTKYPIRLVEAVSLADGTVFVFTTNIKNMSAVEVTEIYKSRWDIETFFKFIKQHLNFSHLLNRTENGIKVVMYVTMIVAILILEYSKRKNLKGFKIPKRKFAQEIENDLLYALIIMCNGDPRKARKMIYRNTS